MSNLLIGIDASRAVKKIRTGPENYSLEIIRALLEADHDNQFILYAPNEPSEPFPETNNYTWKILPQQRLWSQIRLAREVAAKSPDVLFVPSHVVPVLSHLPTVVTIHDLAFKYFPRSYSTFERRYHNFSTGISASKAKKIIVPSQATKHDLLKYYPITKNKIEVVAHGYNRSIFSPTKKQGASPMKNQYILYVGRVEEKKNLRLLIDAFVLFAKEGKKVSLVLAGRNGYGVEMIQQKIKQLPSEIRDLIYLPGHLPQYDMIRYLSHATVFAFPSWYEGFGLSVLEAMATGVPVVCSDSSALPEVAGKSAVLLPPTKPLSWAAAFSKIINEPKFAEELRMKGLKQAEQFSWTEAAKKTLDVIYGAAKR